jgi:hypothetical protein
LNRTNTVAGIGQSFAFGSFFYKGRAIAGNYDEWENYFQRQLVLLSSEQAFSNLRVFFKSTSSENGVPARFGEFQCQKRDFISRFIKTLRSPIGTFFDNCADGNSWRIFSCNGKRIFCVNCKQSCAATEACPGRSLSFNADPTCVYNLALASIISVEFKVLPLYPTVNTPFNITAYSTYLTVSMNASAVGNIFCSAFKRNVTLTSVWDIAAHGASALTSASKNATITLANLMPNMSYSVFCFTQDLTGQVMPLEFAQATRHLTKTIFRKAISLFSTTNIPQYIAGNLASSTLMSMRLNSQPASMVVVNMTAHRVNCNTGSIIQRMVQVFSPSRFTFLVNGEMEAQFAFQASTIGCYQIEARPICGDSYFPGRLNITVRGYRVSPPVPSFESAEYSTDGMSIFATFSASTDQGASQISSYATSFLCANMFNFSGASSAVCAWQSFTTVRITLKGPTYPGSFARLNYTGGTVRAACITGSLCSSYLYIPSRAVIVQTPSLLQAPIVFLVAPTSVSFCTGIRIDPTMSSGAAGRSWMGVEWSVRYFGTTMPAVNATRYLNTNFASITSPAVIPNAFLFPGSSYEISLKLTNFLGKDSSHAVVVTVGRSSEPFIPDVLIYGSQNIAYRWQPLRLYAQLSLPSCLGPISYRRFLVTWKVYNNYTLDTSISSSSLDQQYFIIPPNTLTSNSVYRFAVDVSVLPEDPLSPYIGRAVSVVATNVARSGVVAIISNGSSTSVSKFENILLDASTSYDMDLPSDPLSYRWSCVSTAPVFGASCNEVTLSSTATLSISAGVLRSGSTYNFTVTVSSTSDLYAASASVTVSVVQSRVPVVQQEASPMTVNFDSKLILSNTVLCNFSQASISWSSNVFLSGSSYALTALTRTIGRMGSVSVTPVALVIAAYSLPAGASYSFTLQAAYLSSPNQLASVSYVVTVNGPPSGGMVISTPTSGNALQTLFTVFTTGWTDSASDLPLSYAFLTFTASSESQNYLKNLDSTTSVTSYLGQGLVGMNYVVTVIVYATDILGSKANSSTPVVVMPPANLNDAMQLSYSLVSTGLTGENPSTVYQSVATVVNSITAVSCTTSTSCATLNRQTCQSLADVCGHCLSGYVGYNGDANLPCVSSSLSLSLLSDGSRCTNNLRCESGRCVGGICQVTYKSCPAGCNSRGLCVSYALDSNLAIDRCQYDDSTCATECVCKSGFFGQDCSYTTTSYLTMRLFRDNLCSSLYKAMAFQNVDETILRARALSAAQILIDPTIISSSGLRNCTLFLTSSISRHASLACNAQATAASLVSALSTVLRYANSRQVDQSTWDKFSMVQEVQASLSSLSSGCQTQLSPGESQFEIVSDNVRLATVVVDATIAVNYTMNVPVTSLQVKQNQSQGSIRFGQALAAISEEVGISLVQFTNNPLNTISNSTPVNLEVVSNVAENRKLLTHNFKLNEAKDLTDLATVSSLPIRVLLTNPKPTVYGQLFASTSVVNCSVLSKTAYHFYHRCPDSSVVNVTCPAMQRGQYLIHCPSVEAVPRCASWDLNVQSFQADPLCTVVSYSSMYIACDCRVPLINNRRALQFTSASSIEAQFSSITEIVRDDLSVTYVPGLPIEYAEETIVITSTVLVFGCIFILALLSCAAFKRTEEEKKKKMLPKGHSSSATAIAIADVTPSLRIRTVRSFFRSLFPGPRSKITWRMYLWHSLVQERYVFSWLDIEHPVMSVLGLLEVLAKMWICFLLATVLVYFFYRDDNTCQNIISYDECLYETTFLGTQNKCRWVPLSSSCTLAEHSENAPLVVILIQVVTFVSSLLGFLVHQTIDLLVSEVERKLKTPGFSAVPVAVMDEQISPVEKKKVSVIGDSDVSCTSKVAIINEPDSAGITERNTYESNNNSQPADPKFPDEYHDEFDFDEFVEFQTKRRLMLRAARLTKIMRISELVTTEQEAKYVRRIIDRKIEFSKPIDAAMSFSVFIAQLPRVLGHYDKNLSMWNGENLYDKIVSVAETARDITLRLAQTQSIKDRERLLVLSFMLDIIPSVYHPLILRMLRDAPNTRDLLEIYDRRNLSPTSWQSVWNLVRFWVGGLMLFALFGGGGYAAYLMGVELGCKAIPLWLLLFIVPTIEHIVLIDFLQILCIQVGLKFRVLTEVYRVLWAMMRDRAKLTMMRTSGMLRRTLMSVQHLNAACRVARANPSWPISRYLIAINDNDIAPLLDPLVPVRSKDVIVMPVPGDVIHFAAVPWFSVLSLLNFAFGAWWIRILLNLVVHICVLGAYQLSALGHGSVLMYIPMMVLVIFTLAVIIREVLIYRNPDSYHRYYGQRRVESSATKTLLTRVIRMAKSRKFGRKFNEVAVVAIEDDNIDQGEEVFHHGINLQRRLKPGSVYKEKSVDDDDDLVSRNSEREDKQMQDLIRRADLRTTNRHPFKPGSTKIKITPAMKKYPQTFNIVQGNELRNERKAGDDGYDVTSASHLNRRNKQFTDFDTRLPMPLVETMIDASPGIVNIRNSSDPTGRLNTNVLAHNEHYIFSGIGFGPSSQEKNGDERNITPSEARGPLDLKAPVEPKPGSRPVSALVTRTSRPASAQVPLSRPMSASGAISESFIVRPGVTHQRLGPISRPGSALPTEAEIPSRQQQSERDREKARMNRLLRNARSRLQPREYGTRSRRTLDITSASTNNRPMSALTAILRERAEQRESEVFDRRPRAHRRYDNEYDSVGSDGDGEYVENDVEDDDVDSYGEDVNVLDRSRRLGSRHSNQNRCHQQDSFNRPSSAVPSAKAIAGSFKASPNVPVRPCSAPAYGNMRTVAGTGKQQEAITEDEETKTIASSYQRNRSLNVNFNVTSRQRQRLSRMFQARQTSSSSNGGLKGSIASLLGSRVRPGPGGHSAVAREQPLLEPPRQYGFRVVTQHHHHYSSPTAATTAVTISNLSAIPSSPRHIDDDQMAMVAHFQDEFAPPSQSEDGADLSISLGEESLIPLPFTPMTPPPRNLVANPSSMQPASYPWSLSSANRRDTLRNRRRINRQAFQRAQQQRAAQSETDDAPMYAEEAELRRKSMLAHELSDGLLISLRPLVAATAPALPQYELDDRIPTTLVRRGSQLQRPQTAGSFLSRTQTQYRSVVDQSPSTALSLMMVNGTQKQHQSLQISGNQDSNFPNNSNPRLQRSVSSSAISHHYQRHEYNNSNIQVSAMESTLPAHSSFPQPHPAMQVRHAFVNQLAINNSNNNDNIETTINNNTTSDPHHINQTIFNSARSETRVPRNLTGLHYAEKDEEDVQAGIYVDNHRGNGNENQRSERRQGVSESNPQSLQHGSPPPRSQQHSNLPGTRRNVEDEPEDEAVDI